MDYPTDYPKLTTKFKFTRGKEAYLLHLHDHNCVKNSRHFIFTNRLYPDQGNGPGNEVGVNSENQA